MKRKRNNPVAMVCLGLEVSLQSPFYALLSQGADIALGDICELVDMYAIPVIVRDCSPWVEYLRLYESYHHILHSRNDDLLYCAYVGLPRLVLAMRNNKSFASAIVNAPLNVLGDRL